jgi:uncharacterized membrane protein
MDRGGAAAHTGDNVSGERRDMRIPLKLSLAKTASFATIHFIVAFAGASALPGSAPIAGALALLEPLANTGAYFFHERLWSRLTPQPAPVRSS